MAGVVRPHPELPPAWPSPPVLGTRGREEAAVPSQPPCLGSWPQMKSRSPEAAPATPPGSPRSGFPTRSQNRAVPEESRVPGQDGATPPGRGSPRRHDITMNRMRPSLLSARRERGRESKKGRKKENFWKSLRFLCSSLLFGRQLPSPLPSLPPPARFKMPAYDF